MKSTLYFREKGPICYEAELFSDEEELTSLIQMLLSSDLNWYWASERQYEAIGGYKNWNLPKSRHLALLTSETSELFCKDFLEEDVDMRRRSIGIYGVRLDQAISTRSDLRSEMKEFLSERNSIVHCVVIQINDMRSQYIFVPGEPNNSLQKLLNKWGLGKETADEVCKYARLRMSQLEFMNDSFVDVGFDEGDS